MSHVSRLSAYCLGTCSITVLLFVSLAHAESVVWTNNSVPDLIAIGSDGADRATVSMFHTSASVQYHATPWLIDGGTKVRPIMAGENLPINSRVLFEFSPHVREDISWFGLGGSYDTPYGTWFDGIVPESAKDAKLAPTLVYEKIPDDPDQENKGETYANNVALSIGEPMKRVVVSGAGAQCVPQGAHDQVCTFTEAEDIIGQFEFDTTLGEFFAMWQRKKDPHKLRKAPIAMTLRAGKKKSGGDFDLIVTQQVIPFNFVVADIQNPENHTPTTPSLSSGACTVGQPHTITFSSTDPDGDSLRYFVDWDADGTADEIVPPSGYMASGVSQTSSRTYSTAGSKTVQVKAEDEGGLASSWATLTFTCDEPPPTPTQCTDGVDNDGDGLVDSPDPDCTATAGLSEFPPSPPPPPPGPAAPILNLRVIPSIVRSGNTTQIHWSAQNVQSCTTSAPNGDSWSGISSPLGGKTSRPITQATTYTLSCMDEDNNTHTKQATVRILPTFQER